MEEKLLEIFVKSFIDELIKNSKTIFKELSSEGNNLLKKGISKYLTDQKNKFCKLKTFLKGNTPVYLYDIYYQLNITNRDTDEQIDTSLVSNLFTKSKCITVIGDAGSGKSTLVKHLFLNAISSKYAIPLLIELRYLNRFSEGFEQFVTSQIIETKIQDSIRIIERLFNHGSFVFFLDGYDELSHEIKLSVAENICKFVEKYPSNSFILTTRPYSGIEGLPQFTNYSIDKLSIDNRDVDKFIEKQLKSEGELAGKIIESIKANRSKYIESFLSNPLLLSLYILTFQSNASIPSKKSVFYGRVISALFSEHDSRSKIGYERQKLSKLEQEQFEQILRMFCFFSYFESKFDWDLSYINKTFDLIKRKIDFKFDNQKLITDLKVSISLWAEDNGIYAFAHRSLQEYFAASLIANLDPKEKERMYHKLIEKLSDPMKSSESQNFLSLLDEMDNTAFKTHFYLPILKELRSEISVSSEVKMFESFMRFFVTKLIISEEPSMRVIHFSMRTLQTNDAKVYKGLYVHLKYTSKLCNIIVKSLQMQDNIKKLIPVCIQKINNKKGKETKLYIIDVNKEIPTELWSILKTRISPKLASFSKYIDTEIRKTEELLAKSTTFDRELVDLI